jgi:hypothetical protein
VSRRGKRSKKGLARTGGKSMTAMGEPTESLEKLSARIIAIAGDFLTDEDLSLDERQSRLNAVGSAWNMAIMPPARRQKALAEYIETFQRYSDHTLEDTVAARSVMESLIEEKLRRYPHDQRVVCDAQVTMWGSKLQVNVTMMAAAP